MEMFLHAVFVILHTPLIFMYIVVVLKLTTLHRARSYFYLYFIEYSPYQEVCKINLSY